MIHADLETDAGGCIELCVMGGASGAGGVDVAAPGPAGVDDAVAGGIGAVGGTGGAGGIGGAGGAFTLPPV